MRFCSRDPASVPKCEQKRKGWVWVDPTHFNRRSMPSCGSPDAVCAIREHDTRACARWASRGPRGARKSGHNDMLATVARRVRAPCPLRPPAGRRRYSTRIHRVVPLVRPLEHEAEASRAAALSCHPQDVGAVSGALDRVSRV